MRLLGSGYGTGTKDFPSANVLRALWGEQEETGEVLMLACNLDDMTAEAIGFCMERLLEAGALDVYTTPIGMKKNRPGTLLTCLCRAEQREDMLRCLFRHTTTLGVRRPRSARYGSKPPGAGGSPGPRRNTKTWPGSPGSGASA